MLSLIYFSWLNHHTSSHILRPSLGGPKQWAVEVLVVTLWITAGRNQLRSELGVRFAGDVQKDGGAILVLELTVVSWELMEII